VSVSEGGQKPNRELMLVAGWVLAYFVAHVVGIAFADSVRHIGAIWPASGVGLAAMLSLPRHRWPLVLALFGSGSFAINTLLHGTPALNLGFAIANVGEFAIGACIVVRVCRRDITFGHVDEVLALTAATIIANAAMGLVGAGSTWMFAGAPFWGTYETWATTNVLGAILVAPLAIVWTRRPAPEEPSRRLETLLFAVAWVGSVLITTRARALNGFLLGEEAAAHLGVDVKRERVILLSLASLVTAAGVAVAGLIGFVGLVVPHLVRLLVGPNARLVLPISALFGASLLAAADVVARMLGGVPVGVVTAVIGATFFLLLLRSARSGYEL